jgi:DNA-binding MurR/RpiR family transcriptional regulator
VSGANGVNELARRIREVYPTFTPAESRIADLLLASPELMLGFSATELAERAGVSKPTVTRFIGRLGLSSFQEFRERARTSEVLEAGSPLELLARALDVTGGDLRVLVTESLRRDIDNLERTYLGLDPQDLDEAVDLLVGAPRIAFSDFRKQYALAYYAGTLFNSIRSGVRIVPLPGTSAEDGLLDLGPGDLVVMFPFRRAQRDHDVTSRAVLDRGATLVTIGDRYPNPADERAAIHIVCETDGVGVFDSSVAPMSLINLLFTATANRIGRPAQERLSDLEQQHEIFGTFVRDPSRRNPRRDGDAGS